MRTAALRLVEMSAEAGWRGPDPYDGLFVGWPGLIVGGPRRRQVIVQLHARAPVDIRLLYRRRHSLVPKAPAVLGLAAVRLLGEGDDARARALAADAMETLVADTTCGEYAWGYPWDTQTRWSFYPGGRPNLVATAFSANALAEASAAVGAPAWRERAERAAQWVLGNLYLPDQGYFAYHGRSDRLVHNANLLGASLVHELAPNAPGATEAIRIATARTLRAQRSDGTWPYGEGDGLEWVDSFHTGYILDSLTRLAGVDPMIPATVELGAEAYSSNFFDRKGTPRLWRDRPFPVDSHSAGTGLTVLSKLAEHGRVPIGAVARLAKYTLGHLIDRSGHAVFRRYRWGHARVHYPRWSDAPVALGLASAVILFRGQRAADVESPILDPSRAGSRRGVGS